MTPATLRMNARHRTILLRALVFLVAGVCAAQFIPGFGGGSGVGGGRSRGGPPQQQMDGGHWIQIEGGLTVNEDTIRTARETDTHSTGTPNWTNAPGFTQDTFTFARILFHTDLTKRSGRGWGPRLGWWVDYPDADLNLSYRLQQLTTIKTDPDGRVLRLTDPALHDFPLIYMEHAGYIKLSDEETDALRKYFAAGGALLVNDFWGILEWEGFAAEMDRVLPGSKWQDVPFEHPIFHGIYPLRGPISRLQVPTVQFWNPDYDPRDPDSHLQRVFRGEGSEEVHFRALYDSHQRMMIFVIHNSDISDGWEREGENEEYFHKFSEDIAYPLGINIIFYLMTH